MPTRPCGAIGFPSRMLISGRRQGRGSLEVIGVLKADDDRIAGAGRGQHVPPVCEPGAFRDREPDSHGGKDGFARLGGRADNRLPVGLVQKGRIRHTPGTAGGDGHAQRLTQRPTEVVTQVNR